MRTGAIAGCLILSAWLLKGGPDSGRDQNASSPSPEEQAAVIAETRDAALKFADTLPDFICTQITRRWIAQTQSKATVDFGDPRAPGPAKVSGVYEDASWKLKDTLTVQLSYYHQQEQYKLLLIDGRPAKRSYESAGGATTYGDFWNVLGILFQPSSKTYFDWSHWALLAGQKVMVFRFRVAATNSQWRVRYESQEIVAGLTGVVSIEPNGRRVFAIEVNADAIPKAFPIQKSGVKLDYRPQVIGNVEYLLPLRAVEWNKTRGLATRNEVEFRLYRKFSTDSKVDFETPPPLPRDQVEEALPK